MWKQDRTIPLTAGGEIALDHAPRLGFVTLRIEAEDGDPGLDAVFGAETGRSCCTATVSVEELEDLARKARRMALEEVVRMERLGGAENCALPRGGPMFCSVLPDCRCRRLMAGGL
jgi:hypothetical protein